MRRVLLGIAAVTLLNCASHNYAPKILTPQQLETRHFYRYSPCTEEKLVYAFNGIKSREGCAECALYYFRCRELASWEIKARRQ